MAPDLSVEVFVGSAEGLRSTSAIITGERDAVLVDVQFLLTDAHRLAADVLDTGKNLTTIYVTHSHPDHWFTLSLFAYQFPDVRMVAIPEVAQQIQEIRQKKVDQWRPVFGAKVPSDPIAPEPMEGMTLDLEGETLEIQYLDWADEKPATTVWVPSLKTLVAADLAFNGTHLYVGSHDADARKRYLENVIAMGDLGASRIIPGHKATSDSSEDPDEVIAWTRGYLETFEKLFEESPDEETFNARVAETWGDIPLEFCVPINAAAAWRGEYF